MSSFKTILVTGGAGYIGSHTTLMLLLAGFDVVVLDTLCNSSAESLIRVAKLSGRTLTFVEGDIRERTVLDRIFSVHPVKAVLHFAGLKSVGDSVTQPLTYYSNNVIGTITLCQSMEAAGVFTLVFSSSATVYGVPVSVPIAEDQLVGNVTNPYGRSKFMVEQVLGDLAVSDSRWRVALLRYFNPVGAHESGQIGEDPNGIPTNLLPYVAQVAMGRLAELAIFGDDYPTEDGTGVRDYIHVMDLAEGHLAALAALNESHTCPGARVWNLGTGQGYSVLEVVRAFEVASGLRVPYGIVPRRPGDVACCYADPAKAARELGWSAQRSLDQMMRDTWRWQQQNPNGYRA